MFTTALSEQADSASQFPVFLYTQTQFSLKNSVL